jgi:hypothetical protein
MDGIRNDVSLARYIDERNKVWMSLKPWLLGVEYFNMDIAQPYMDGEGFESMQGMNRNLFYLTDDNLRKQGSVEIPKVQDP